MIQAPLKRIRTSLLQALATLALLGSAPQALATDCGEPGAAFAVDLNSTVNCTRDPAGDLDVFLITIDVPGQIVIRSQGSTDTLVQLARSDGTVLAEDDDSEGDSNFRLEGSIDPAQYLLTVSGFAGTATGPYALQVLFQPNDACGSLEGATTVEINTTTNCALEAADDQDWLFFELTAPMRVSVRTLGNVDTYGFLLTPDGTVLGSADDGGPGENFGVSGVLEPGSYFVQVSSGSGSVGPYGFVIEAEAIDTCGSIEQTVPLELNSARSCALEASDDEDWFFIDLPVAGVLTVNSTGDVDTTGQLLDETGTVLDSDDDAGADQNFLIERVSQAGVYFIRVAGFSSATGSYELNVSFSSDDSCGAADNPSAIATDSLASCELEFGGDEDWFSVEITEPGNLTVVSESTIDTVGLLFDSEGNQLAIDDDGNDNSDFRIEFEVRPGIYLVQVRGFSSGTSGVFDLRTSFEATSSLTDTCGSNPNDVLLYVPDVSVPCALETVADSDFFVLLLEAPGTLNVTTDSDIDTRGQLINGRGDVLLADDDGGEGRNFLIRQELEPGTYLIAVNGFGRALGEYQLNATFEPADNTDSCGFGAGTATIVLPNSTTPCEFERSGDVDYIRVILPRDGTLRAWSTGTVDTVGSLTNATGDVLLSDDDSGEDANFLFERELSAGVYLIEVAGFAGDVGTFEVNVAFAAGEVREDLCGAADAPVALALPGSLDCSIEASGDRDFFAITVVTAGTLTVRSTGDTDTVAVLLDPAGVVLAENDDAGGSRNFGIETDLQPGLYVLQVAGFGLADGDYAIEASLSTDDSCGSLSGPEGLIFGQPTNCELEFGHDIDLFVFQVETDGDLVVRTTGTTDTFGALFNQSGEVVADDDDGDGNGNFRIEARLTPGYYAIGVRGFSTETVGEYAIEASFSAVEVVSDVCGTPEMAVPLLANARPTPCALEVAGDHDYFLFELTEESSVGIVSAGPVDTVATLFDSAGNVIAVNDDAGNGRNFGLELRLAALGSGE